LIKVHDIRFVGFVAVYPKVEDWTNVIVIANRPVVIDDLFAIQPSIHEAVPVVRPFDLIDEIVPLS
jgi:hypothetical protein